MIDGVDQFAHGRLMLLGNVIGHFLEATGPAQLIDPADGIGRGERIAGGGSTSLLSNRPERFGRGGMRARGRLLPATDQAKRDEPDHSESVQ